MHSAYLIVVILAAAANIYAATNDFTRPAWIMRNMATLGVEEHWLPALGILKALGGLGLLVGIFLPSIGVAAAMGLLLFFMAAMASAIRVRWYAHLPFPLVWFALAGAALALRLRST